MSKHLQPTASIDLTVPELETLVWALDVAARKITHDRGRTSADKRTRINWLTNRSARVAQLANKLQEQRNLLGLVKDR